jgi:hypothetical protein
MPQAGDNIVFEFSQPVELHGYRLRSGNYEHPSDLLYNTSVEIRPTDPERVKETLKISPSEQFIGVGKFLTIALYSAPFLLIRIKRNLFLYVPILQGNLMTLV